VYITGHSDQVMARSSPIHFGALEQRERMDVDAIAISKFQNEWLSMAVGDGPEPLLHMHDRHNRLTGIDQFQYLLWILDLWNREGAWAFTHLPFQSSKVTSRQERQPETLMHMGAQNPSFLNTCPRI
jgi:hypothetical protein